MKIETYKKVAKLIRSDDVYNVYDLRLLQNLVLSLTELHPDQQTKGHSHEEADEVYVITSGNGRIEIGEEGKECEQGEVFIIPRGLFHKMYNTGKKDLKFWSIFEKYGERQ